MKPDIDWLLDKLERGHWDQDADDYEAVLLYAKKLEAAESEVASRARREAFEEAAFISKNTPRPLLDEVEGQNTMRDAIAANLEVRAAEEGKG